MDSNSYSPTMNSIRISPEQHSNPASPSAVAPTLPDSSHATPSLLNPSRPKRSARTLFDHNPRFVSPFSHTSHLSRHSSPSAASSSSGTESASCSESDFGSTAAAATRRNRHSSTFQGERRSTGRKLGERKTTLRRTGGAFLLDQGEGISTTSGGLCGKFEMEQENRLVEELARPAKRRKHDRMIQDEVEEAQSKRGVSVGMDYPHRSNSTVAHLATLPLPTPFHTSTSTIPLPALPYNSRRLMSSTSARAPGTPHAKSVTPTTPPSLSLLLSPRTSLHPYRRTRASSLPVPLIHHRPTPSPLARSLVAPSPSTQARQSRKQKLYETPATTRLHATIEVASSSRTSHPSKSDSSSKSLASLSSRTRSTTSSTKLVPNQLLALHTVYSLPRFSYLSSRPLEFTSLAPPITRASLKELDLNEILRNPQLRHDVVFDPNLMFRPNHDGERGDRKRVASNQYWTAVSREIFLSCRCTTFSSGALLPCLCVGGPSPLSLRLPSRIGPLVTELRNILLSLLPTTGSTLAAASREVVKATLDPEIVQHKFDQGEKQICLNLARFMGDTLKVHCAPMRDKLVDEMVKACEVEGEAMTKGLRMCFEILELMKLDIANHQLRSLRPYLLQTALDFELKSFHEYTSRRFSQGHQLPCEKTRLWLSSHVKSVQDKVKPRTLTKSDLIERSVREGLLDLIFRPTIPPRPTPLVIPCWSASTNPSRPPTPPLISPISVPETLQLDLLRLQSFHSDATDLTVVYMLLLLFQQLVSPSNPTTEDMELMKREIWCIMSASVGSYLPPVAPSTVGMGGVIQSPPGDGIQKLESPAWRKGMENVLLQIGARVQFIKTRSSTPNATLSTPTSSLLPPDESTLRLITSYFSTNMRPTSRLFLLLQSRLQETVGTVLIEQFALDAKRGPTFGGWWIPQPAPLPVDTGRTTLGGCTRRANALNVPARLIAESGARRGTKRSHAQEENGQTEDESSEEEDAANEREPRKRRVSGKLVLRMVPSDVQKPTTENGQPKVSLVDVTLAKNGLNVLGAEVRALGERVAKLGIFHYKVYSSWYSTLLP